MAKATEASVLKHYNELAGREDYFELREVDTMNEGKVTQVISAGGSLVAQVNATGQDALERLAESTGAEVIDTGSNPKDSVLEDKEYRAKSGVVAFPTQPEALEAPSEVREIDNSDKAIFEEQTSERTENQASVKTRDQRSSGAASDTDR